MHRVHEVISAAQDLLEIMGRLVLLVMLGHLGLLDHVVLLVQLEMQELKEMLDLPVHKDNLDQLVRLGQLVLVEHQDNKGR